MLEIAGFASIVALSLRMISPLDRIAVIRAAQPAEGLFAEKDWLVSPEPFVIEAGLAEQLRKLGHRLNLFQRACNELYHRSVSGKQPSWIAAYLDAGKPADLVAYGRRKEARAEIPLVIRPDLVLTESGPDGPPGFTIAELDSVPGGIGLTQWLNATYASFGTHDLIGGATGMLEGFGKILGGSGTVLISKEAATYKPEMEYLARLSGGAIRVADAESFSPEGWRKLAGGNIAGMASTNALHPGRGAGGSSAPAGADAVGTSAPGVLSPANIHQPSGLKQEDAALGAEAAAPGMGGAPLSLYRFFEHFDLPNIPAAAAIMDAVEHGAAKITPPFKPYLEEKLWFALFWLRPLREYWRRELSERHFLELQKVIPYTWILDPTPLPQHAVIPGLEVHAWEEVKAFSQKERELILKISGFHETAWGSRSVVLGSDSSHPEWQAAIDGALAGAGTHPHILQRFHKGRLVEQPYLDPATGEIAVMKGRVRLCPYYFVIEGKAELRGALATICPPDKKLLHGMKDAIMAPTAVDAAEASAPARR